VMLPKDDESKVLNGEFEGRRSKETIKGPERIRSIRRRFWISCLNRGYMELKSGNKRVTNHGFK